MSSRYVALIRSVEITEETLEGIHLWKVTYFENGLDVAMFRFDNLKTLLSSIRQFFIEEGRNVTF